MKTGRSKVGKTVCASDRAVVSGDNLQNGETRLSSKTTVTGCSKKQEGIDMKISKTTVTAIIGVLFSFCAIDCIGTDIKAKNGQWEGKSSVSFVVEDGEIVEFKMFASRSTFEKCSVEIPEIPVDKSGKFSLEETDDNFTISGEFTTSTTVQGKIILNYCAPSSEGGNAAVFLVPLEQEWTAKPK